MRLTFSLGATRTLAASGSLPENQGTFTADNSKMRSARDYRGYLCGLWTA
jgi:hypothetical protein